MLSDTNSSRRMDIIDETYKMYAIIDPLNFDNMSNHSKSYDGEGEILELDRISCYAQYIQQVLSDKNKLKYFLTNNAPHVINILTSYDLIEEYSMVAEFEDSLFTYEFAKNLKGKVPHQQIDGVSDMKT